MTYDELVKDATAALNGILARYGATIPPEYVNAIAMFTADGINGAARRHAEAAGKAAADAITTEDAAEAAQRKP